MTVPIRALSRAALGLALMISGCGRDSNPVLVHPGYPPSPYGYPTVNPVDSTIGFAYAPLLSISQTHPGSGVVTSAGGYYFQFSGPAVFWVSKWDGSVQYRASDRLLPGASWSPNGTSLTYAGQNITSVPWDGDSLNDAARTELPGAAPYLDPRWNGAMTKIVMWGSPGIFIWRAATSLVSNFGMPGWIQPDWSPDGSMIVFHGFHDQKSAVMIADTLGTNVRVLVEGLDYLANPRWSPDGSRIAFVGRFGSGDLQVWTVKTDGSGLSQITTHGAGEHLAWSPSGSEIVYVHYSYLEFTCAGGNFPNGTIWSVNPSTGAHRQITANAGLDCP